jgi:hypothetical protein
MVGYFLPELAFLNNDIYKWPNDCGPSKILVQVHQAQWISDFFRKSESSIGSGIPGLFALPPNWNDGAQHHEIHQGC